MFDPKTTTEERARMESVAKNLTGYTCGFYWREANWECGRNCAFLDAYDDNNTVEFTTAWVPPEGIFKMLVNKHPNETFHLKWIEPGCVLIGEMYYNYKEEGIVYNEPDWNSDAGKDLREELGYDFSEDE
jgi:hypothetical protein